MSGNDGSGCAGQILVGVLLALVLAAVVAWTGLPTWDGTLAWDTAATTEREQTKRHEITEDNQTERERIAADAATSTQWAITLRWLGVAAAVGVGAWAWSRRPHRPVPPTVTMLLPHYPGHVAELIDGQWCVVEPVSGEYYTAQDAVRLLTTNKV